MSNIDTLHSPNPDGSPPPSILLSPDLPNPGPPPGPSHNSKYYLEDEMTIFLVENQLFKVHRHFLIRESDVFRWMFTCPPRREGPEGGTDEKFIPLPGVTCAEFESLLDFFYTGMHDTPISGNHLIDLLSISTRFDFEQIRQLAISRLECLQILDPIEKIVLAVKHDIPQWLAPAYEALCQRPNPLNEGEARKIGWTKTVLVAQAREEVRESCDVEWAPKFSPPPPSPPPPHEFHQRFSSSQVAGIVNQVFFPRPADPGP